MIVAIITARKGSKRLKNKKYKNYQKDAIICLGNKNIKKNKYF